MRLTSLLLEIALVLSCSGEFVENALHERVHDLLVFRMLMAIVLALFALVFLTVGACFAFLPLHDAWLFWLFFLLAVVFFFLIV